MSKNNIPILEKQNLTIEEAAEYSNIGIHKLRALLRKPSCTFVLHVGSGKKLIKKKQFDEYIENSTEV